MSYEAFISYSHAADGKLAPALQNGLQRIAKPLYRLRAMRVFRDETSLQLTPALWKGIQGALNESQNFILMASPNAAESKWVQREIEEWLRLNNNSLNNFSIILTEGEIFWDNERSDFNWEKTTALPRNLQGKFDSEPLYLDFRWAKNSDHLSLRNPKFLNSIGKLASAIRNEPLDSIIGEDVKQHRRFRFITGITIALLLFLLTVTSYAAFYATQQAEIAKKQTAIATQEKDRAEHQKKIAEEQSRIAKEQTDLAIDAKDKEKTARKLADKKRQEAETATKNESIAKNQAEDRRKQAEQATRNETIAKNQAEEKRLEAEKSAASERVAKNEAERRSRLNIAQSLAVQSNGQFRNNPQQAGLLAAESIQATLNKDGYIIPEARVTANQALSTLTGIGLYGHFQEGVTNAIFNKDETLIAAFDRSGLIQVFELGSQFQQSAKYVINTEGFSNLITFDLNSRYLITQTKSYGCRSEINTSKKSPGCGFGMIWNLDNNQKFYNQPIPLYEKSFEAMIASDDFSLLAAATENEILIFDLSDLSERRILKRLQKSSTDVVTVLEFSKDKSLLLSGSQSGWVQIWDLTLEKTKPKAVFESKHKVMLPDSEKTVPIEVIHIADDKSALVTASPDFLGDSTQADRSVILWKLENLTPVDQPRRLTHKQGIVSVNFTMSNHSVVTTSLDGEVRRWRINTNDDTEPELLTFVRCNCNSSEPFKNIISAKVFPDENFMAIASSDKTLRLIDLNNAAKEPIELRGNDSSVNLVTVSPKGQWLVSGGNDKSLRVWNIDDEVPITGKKLTGNWRTDYVASVISSMKTTAVLITNNQLEIWDISEKDLSRQILIINSSIGKEDCPTCLMKFSPDGKWLVVQSDSNKNQSTVISTDGITKFDIPVRTWSVTGESQFSPDSNWLYTAEKNGGQLYNLLQQPITSVILETNGKSVYTDSVKFSRDSRWLLAKTLSYDSSRSIEGYLWRINSENREVHKVEIDDFNVGLSKFSEDGQWLAYSKDKEGEYTVKKNRARILEEDPLYPIDINIIRLSEKAEKLEPINLYKDENGLDDLVFSPDSRWLLTATSNTTNNNVLNDKKNVRLWDLHKDKVGEDPLMLTQINKPLREAVFSPDGHFLLTNQGGENFARLWHLDEHNNQFIIVGSLQGVMAESVTFSQDSKRLVSSLSGSKTPFLWFLSTDGSYSTPIKLSAANQGLREVKFSKDNNKLFVLSSTESKAGSNENQGSRLVMFDVKSQNREIAPEEIFTSNEEDLAQFQISQDGNQIFVPGKGLMTLSIYDNIELLNLLGNSIGRNMTWDEWLLSGQNKPYHKTFQTLPVHESVLRELIQRVSINDKMPGGISLSNLLNWTIESAEPILCNELGWNLAIIKEGQLSLKAAECALKQFPNNGNYRDTRGIARALVGDKNGAIEDFNAYIQDLSQKRKKFPNQNKFGIQNQQDKLKTIEERQQWIIQLSNGENPFLVKSEKRQ